MVVQSILLVLGSYFVGSIPTAYLAGRWLRGIDVRHYGSGTVSGSMVWEHVARWAIVPVGLFDIAKAALPTWLALRWGMGETVAAIAGLAAAVGHSWPIFLRFTGGRGLSCFMGILLVLFPPGVLWLLVFLAIGWVLGDSAPWALASLAGLPILARAVGGPANVGWIAAGMLILTLVKRLEANRRPLPSESTERRRVLFWRAFFDRDIPSHREWLRRQPDQE